MSSQSFTHRALIAFTATGIAAIALGVTLGSEATQRFAAASPPPRMQGTLGFGKHSIAPVSEVPALDKVVVTDERPASIVTSVVKAEAPTRIIKPVLRPKGVAKPRFKTIRAAAPTRSSAIAAVWRFAKASWYGPGFYGRKTASGAVLTTDMMNVAHRTLPFGTRIEFEYKGRTAIAVVNDRGPFTAGRVFDLGPGTAKVLGFRGVGTVKYRVLGR